MASKPHKHWVFYVTFSGHFVTFSFLFVTESVTGIFFVTETLCNKLSFCPESVTENVTN